MIEILILGIEKKSQKTNNDWWMLFELVQLADNLLTTVLIGKDGIKPILEPKGLPSDLSSQLINKRKTLVKGTEVVGESYLQIEEVQNLENLRRQGLIMPNETIFSLILRLYNLLKKTESDLSMRIVFWKEVIPNLNPDKPPFIQMRPSFLIN